MLQDRLKIKFADEEKELFMSFMRLNSCIRATGNGEEFAGVVADPDQGELLLKIMLADKGQNVLDVELDEDSLTPADYDRVITWVSEHLVSFFVSKLKEAQARAADLEPLRAELQKSLPTG